MVRLILLIIIILFIAWVLQPFLDSRGSSKNKDTVDRILDPDQRDFRKQKAILIIVAAVILSALVLWILPKFGINFLALLQKLIPIISSLRSILPF